MKFDQKQIKNRFTRKIKKRQTDKEDQKKTD